MHLSWLCGFIFPIRILLLFPETRKTLVVAVYCGLIECRSWEKLMSFWGSCGKRQTVKVSMLCESFCYSQNNICLGKSSPYEVHLTTVCVCTLQTLWDWFDIMCFHDIENACSCTHCAKIDFSDLYLISGDELITKEEHWWTSCMELFPNKLLCVHAE